MKILSIIYVCLVTLTLNGSEDRIWINATINGQPVNLAFDTGAGFCVLFRNTAERLKIKLLEPSPGIKPPAGQISAQATELCSFVWGSYTDRMKFGVVDLPPYTDTKMDGVLSWIEFRNAVMVFDSTNGLTICSTAPTVPSTWQKFRQNSALDVLAFEVDAQDQDHRRIYVDTGDEGGIALNHVLWEKWVATRTEQAATIVSFDAMPGGPLFKQQMWADSISIGSLCLSNLPIREYDLKEESPIGRPKHAATLGLYALRRLDLVVDGGIGMVYAHPREDEPLAFPHNQLGAVFDPGDNVSDKLLAHVVVGSPAWLAGIRNGDVLLKFDDLDVTQWRKESKPPGLGNIWRDSPPGTKYKLTLQRGTNQYDTTVTLKRILGPSGHIGPAFLPPADLRNKAEKGDAKSQTEWGVACLLGSGGARMDENEGVRWLRQAAAQNYADAQNKLGVCYANGLGVAKDEIEAVKWYRQAAEKNDASAQKNLGVCYAMGRGIAKNEIEAVKWYRKAAEQKYTPAQVNLGTAYAKGLGIAIDQSEAVKWYRKAAEQKDVQAQYNLAYCYASGLGVAKDDVEATRWFLKAAQQNDAASQSQIGLRYVTGLGVAKNETEAVKWLRKAAQQNDPGAQWNLAMCFLNGIGVAKDEVEGYKWALLALAQGEPNAKAFAAQFASHLTAEQIAQAQKLAREFTPPIAPSVEKGNAGLSLSPQTISPSLVE